jgi:hypothetical protein
MLTNKVLSPQFVIWLLPFVALLPVPQYSLGLAATALTIVIFPFNYDGLVRLETPIVLLLNLRNLVLASLTASVLWRLRPLAAENRVVPGIAKVGSANHLDSPAP